METWPVIYFIFFFSLFVSAYGGASIKIGAILTGDLQQIKMQKSAIEASAQMYNTSASTVILNIRTFNGTSSSLEAASAVEDLTNFWGTDAVIYGGTWSGLPPVSRTKTEVTVLSLAAVTSYMVPPKGLLFQMPYSLHLVVRCITHLAKSFGWRRLNLIYEDGDYGSMGTTIKTFFTEALHNTDLDIDHIIAFPPQELLEDPRQAVRLELEKVNRQLCKVFVVVQLSAVLALNLFKEAQKLGMIAGHVWITDDRTTTLFLSDIRSFSPYVQGVIGVKAYGNTSLEPHRTFQGKIKLNYQLDLTGYYAYDSVHVIALAARKKEDLNISLFDAILLNNFEGLSGHVAFRRENHYVVRDTSSMVFSIVNFVRNCSKSIGFWSEKHGFYEEVTGLSQHLKRVDCLSQVYWPGGARRVPSGWGKLRIGVPARTSFDQFVKVEYSHDGNMDSVTGYCIDVFNSTLQKLKYDLDYEFIPFKGTYDELINQVYQKKFDAVVGDFTILAERLEKVDFTQPYVSSDLAMVVRIEPDSKAWVFFMPFTGGVWALIIFTFVYKAMIVWCLEHKHNPEFNGSWKKQLGATLWLMVGSAFLSPKTIKSFYTKTVVMSLFFTALVVTQVYTANLSSLLTTQKLQPLVSDREIGCDGDSFIVKYLQDVLGYKRKRIHMIDAAEKYPKAFESGIITAAYMETPYARVFLSRHNGYAVHGETHRLGGLGFVFQRGSPLTIDFSKAILQLSEEGILKDLENKWFSFSLSSCPSTEKQVVNKDSIGLDDMWALFILTGGITSLVFLIFIQPHCRMKISMLLKGGGSASKKQQFVNSNTDPAALNEVIIHTEHVNDHSSPTSMLSENSLLVREQKHDENEKEISNCQENISGSQNNSHTQTTL